MTRKSILTLLLLFSFFNNSYADEFDKFSRDWIAPSFVNYSITLGLNAANHCEYSVNSFNEDNRKIKQYNDQLKTNMFISNGITMGVSLTHEVIKCKGHYDQLDYKDLGKCAGSIFISDLFLWYNLRVSLNSEVVRVQLEF